MKIKLIVPAICAATLAACGGDDNSDNEVYQALLDLGIECTEATSVEESEAAGTLSLSLIDTYASGNDFDTSSAEIVSYDSCSDRLYVVNSEDATIDVLSLAATNSAPSKESTIDLAAAATAAGVEIGAANSVSAKQGLVAVAIEAATKQDAGLIALYRSDTLALIGTYTAGALPDMVALTDDARYILTANEGEPSADYSNDPEGSVTVVDLKEGFDAANAVVNQVSFAEFNTDAARAAEMPMDVRLAGPAGTSVAQDLEPEYIALNTAGDTAWVALQENNALAIIDIESASVTAFKGLGLKSWNAASGNELDASNKDAGTGEFASYEQLVGLYTVSYTHLTLPTIYSV